MSDMVEGFFAYPSSPTSSPEAIRPAIRAVNSGGLCHLRSWEDCRIGGKLIIETICRAIDHAPLFCADLTDFNANVMFELGYAIARRRRIWLLLDTSYTASKHTFEQLRILTTVGYAAYCNSQDITHSFYRDQPWTDLQNTIYSMTIESAISRQDREALLHLKARHNTEAAVRLNAEVKRANIPLTIDDPKESAVQPLAWYVRKALAAIGVLAHLSGPGREGAVLHNCRYAFVSGLAHGFQKHVLMLAESTYVSPIDYRDILRTYASAEQCATLSREWLESIAHAYAVQASYRQDYVKAAALADDLKHLQIGEYIAENEEGQLQEYFIETSAFLDALAGKQTLVVGRKGTGKTANLYAVASRLASDPRNLVCIVKPASYELESIVRLLREHDRRDEKGYLVESLWKFLLYSELGRIAAAQLEPKRDAFPIESPESRLLELMERNDAELGQDFAIRLERAVASLALKQANPGGPFAYGGA